LVKPEKPKSKEETLRERLLEILANPTLLIMQLITKFKDFEEKDHEHVKVGDLQELA